MTWTALVALMLVTQGEPDTSAKEQPLALGRLVGARSSARVRGGVWFGNLSPGPMTLTFDSSKALALGTEGDYERIGRGTGLLRDFGVDLTVGDYDFALGFLSDQLFAPAEDALGDSLAATVIQQLIGQVRTRALKELVGTEVWATVRVGNFDGPIDARAIGVRDGQVYFGGKDSRWDTSYFSAETGAVDSGPMESSLFVRFTTFSMPAALELPGELSTSPLTLQEASVYAGGLGLSWQGTAELGFVELEARAAFVPFTGVAVVSYGDWGSLIGFLLEASGRLALIVDLPIADIFALRPYVAFEAQLVSPVVVSMSLEDLNAPSVALPDWVVWGPQVGLEVRL
jgi:hypothetical protein